MGTLSWIYLHLILRGQTVCENTPVRKIQRGLGVGLISPRVAATLLPIACQGNNERFRKKAQLINFSYPAPIGVQQLAASHRWFDLCARF